MRIETCVRGCGCVDGRSGAGALPWPRRDAAAAVWVGRTGHRLAIMGDEAVGNGTPTRVSVGRRGRRRAAGGKAHDYGVGMRCTRGHASTVG